MSAKSRDYIPALRYTWLTRFYDPIIALTARERTFKQKLLHQANLPAQGRVLDVGCGTGTLAIWIKQENPHISVTGLDGDPKVLEIARQKARRINAEIILDEGLSFELPYPDASFDRVFSSLFFHHLTRVNKIQTFEEIFRVLKPNGELHISDWGKPANALMRGLFLGVRLLDGFETTRDNALGLLPEFMAQAGFKNVRGTGEVPTLYGTMGLYAGDKLI